MIKPSIVAFIPARSGSKRIPNKNILTFEGHPMLAYSIRSAVDSGIFDQVVCATDSKKYADIAQYYGAEVPFLRDRSISGDKSADIEWVAWTLKKLHSMGKKFDAFSILRPTSPFRLPETIQRAWQQFIGNSQADSLRAVEKCKQHPGKMWVIQGKNMLPLLPYSDDTTPWHSSQYAALPKIYVQNASLEIAWTRVVLEQNSIAGEVIIPFISQGNEGFDLNNPEDVWLARYLLDNCTAKLPNIDIHPITLK